ncbi:hypothetical protein ACET3Z_021230 [Daucus carota]
MRCLCVSKRVFADSRLHDIPMSISGHACRGWCTRNDISIFWMHNSFPKMCIAKSCIYPFLCLSKLQNLSVDLWVELLTGKTPFQDLVQEHGADIPRWVRSVREEETESGDDPGSSNKGSGEKLTALLNIAMACVALTPNNRLKMREVLRMIKETRAEAQVSSNSSDHSPGRWSDIVQSLPREDNLSI